MKVIVPLAGPDFELEDGSTKSEQTIECTPLLRRALDNRPWAAQQHVTSSDYVFVLRDTAISRRFAASNLESWYPSCKTVFLSDYARGAALSAASGISSISGKDEPVIVDLADIEFQASLDLIELFSKNAKLGAIALTFKSDNPCYSYILENKDGIFVEAAEKRVISDNASAGVYLFRSSAIYFSALAHALTYPESHVFNGLFYVCPLFNGVAAGGWSIYRQEVADIIDVKASLPS